MSMRKAIFDGAATSRRGLLWGGLASGAAASLDLLSVRPALASEVVRDTGQAPAAASHVSNTLEIIEVVTRYSYAVDHQDWEAFNQVFAPGAVIDLSGTPDGGTYRPAELRDKLKEMMARPGTEAQHILRNTLVLPNGGAALATSELVATTRTPIKGSDAFQLLRLRAVVFDELAMTAVGWRIRRRTVLAKSQEVVPPNARDWQPLIAATRSEPRDLTHIEIGARQKKIGSTSGGLTLIDAQDRIEIEQLLAASVHGLNQGWDALHQAAFTEAATVRVRRAGTVEMAPSEYAKATSGAIEGGAGASQHLIFNTSMAMQGDTATVMSNMSRCVYGVVAAGSNKVKRLMEGGLVYDTVVRTADGWRIAQRTIVTNFSALDDVDCGPGLAKAMDVSRPALAARPAPGRLTPEGEPVASPTALTEQEQIDRVDIYRAMVAYAHGQDEQWWELHQNTFTADGVFDQPAGMGVLTASEFTEALRRGRHKSFYSAHGVGNLLFSIDGDQAHVVSEGLAHAIGVDEHGNFRGSGLVGHYVDRFVRTPRGWRIKKRYAGLREATREPLNIPQEAEGYTRDATRAALAELVHL